MLVDRDDFGLNFEYSGAITDPDDPEVTAERAKLKRAGIKPPPQPLLRPIAQRDPGVTASMLEQLKAEAVKYSIPAEAEKKPQGLADLIRLMNS